MKKRVIWSNVDLDIEDWRDGYKEFLEIYNSTGMYEAGYNAAIILVAQERYEEASELMSDVYRTSGNLKARDAIKEIQFEIQSRDKLQKQTETRENI